jgi:hypothetical protein
MVLNLFVAIDNHIAVGRMNITVAAAHQQGHEDCNFDYCQEGQDQFMRFLYCHWLG